MSAVREAERVIPPTGRDREYSFAATTPSILGAGPVGDRV
jgi:hypothetical protein